MRNKWFRRFFPLFALLLLAPWPIAYAHDADGALAGQDIVPIEIAEASAQPTWTAFGKAIGGVTPGELFSIDATNNAADIQVNLYITNAPELIGSYGYLILNVGIYVETDGGEWKEASRWDGELIPDTLITMRNGQVSFTLPGYAKYKVTIDSGSFRCIRTEANGGSLAPQFYLEVD